MKTRKQYEVHTVVAGRELIDEVWNTNKMAKSEVAKILAEGRQAWIVVREYPA